MWKGVPSITKYEIDETYIRKRPHSSKTALNMNGVDTKDYWLALTHTPNTQFLMAAYTNRTTLSLYNLPEDLIYLTSTFFLGGFYTSSRF